MRRTHAILLLCCALSTSKADTAPTAPVAQTVSGNGFTLARHTDGTVSAWGKNKFGELGLGDTTNRLTPTLVPGLTDVEELVAGRYGYYTFARHTDGTVSAWGYNSDGRLGLGDTTNRYTPTLVPSLTDVEELQVHADGTWVGVGLQRQRRAHCSSAWGH